MESFLNSLTDESQLLFVVGLAAAFVLAIALVIVIFVSRIRFLKNRIFEAKEIDDAKNRTISELEKKLKEIKIKDDALELELKQFNDTKASLQSKKELIFKMQERMDILEERERNHLETVEAYSKEFQTLGYRYKGLKKRNEFLVEENSRFRIENTKILMKVREQERRIFEKLMSLQGNAAEQKKEIEKIAGSIIEKNNHLFNMLDYDTLSSDILPLTDTIINYQKEIVSSFKKSLERERNMKGDLGSIVESRQKVAEKTETIIEKLKDKDKLDEAALKILEDIVKMSSINKEKINILKNDDENKSIIAYAIDLPNGQRIEIDTTVSISKFEEYRREMDGAKKEKALSEFMKYFHKKLEELSKLSGTQGSRWLFVPSDDALSVLCKNPGRLCEQAEKKGIVLIGPTTLILLLDSIVSLWDYKQNYDLAMQLIEKSEEIRDLLTDYGEKLSDASQNLEMIQGSLPVGSPIQQKNQ